jgi:hypothetical protein
MRYRFADECGESGGIHVRDHASDDVSLAADCADDWSFAGTDTARSAASAALIPMSVFSQAADESFIDFDNSAELIDVLHESSSNLMAHEPCGFIGTEPHVTIKLQGAHALLANEHQVNDAIPFAQRFVRILENRPGDVGKAVRNPQSIHSHLKAMVLSSKTWPLPQRGQLTPSGHRRATRYAQHARSSGNSFSNWADVSW